MADVGLQIRIGAEVAQGVQGIKTVTTNLKGLEVGAAKVSESITKTAQSLTKVTPGANQASNALMNLGRIAQDAPFGFIGISNNINPLLESFQRLKAETGSTGGALKALVTGLAGGAGLGLAVSVATGLLTIFSDKLFSTKKTVDEAAEAAKKYAEAQHDSRVDVEKQLVTLESLVNIAKSDVSSKQQQVDALKKLNEIIPDNIGHLDALNIKTAEGTRIVAAYVTALQHQAVAELLTNKAADLRVAEFERKQKFIETQIDLNKKLKVAQDQAQFGSQLGEVGVLSKEEGQQNVVNVLNAIKKAQDDFVKGRIDFNSKIKTLTGETEKEIGLGLPVTLPTPPKVKAGKVEMDAVKLEMKAAEVKLADISQAKTKLAFTDLFSLDTSTLKGVLGQGNLPGLAALGRPLIPQATLDQIVLAGKALGAMEAQADKLAGVLTATLGNAFVELFDTIASGGSNALQAFGQAIKQIITKLIAAAITAAIFAAIISAATGGAGTAAFGAQFKGIFSQLSGLPKFAAGGIVTGPTVLQAGEAGAEAIIPLSQLPGLIARMVPANTGSSNVTVEGVLRGSDLYLINARESKRFGSSIR
jgi:hypothetical protein